MTARGSLLFINSQQHSHVSAFLTMFSSVCVPLCCFALHTWLGGEPLTAGVIFASLSLFNQLTMPLFIVPFAIPIIVSSMVSTRRLEEFLSRPEMEKITPWNAIDFSVSCRRQREGLHPTPDQPHWVFSVVVQYRMRSQFPSLTKQAYNHCLHCSNPLVTRISSMQRRHQCRRAS